MEKHRANNNNYMNQGVLPTVVDKTPVDKIDSSGGNTLGPVQEIDEIDEIDSVIARIIAEAGKKKEYLYKYPPRDRPLYAMLQCHWTIPPRGNSVADCHYHHRCRFGHEEDRYFDDPWVVQRFTDGINVELLETRIKEDGDKDSRSGEELIPEAGKINQEEINGGDQKPLVAEKVRNQVSGDDTTQVLQDLPHHEQLPSPPTVQPVQLLNPCYAEQSLQSDKHPHQQQHLEPVFQQQQHQHQIHQKQFSQQFEQNYPAQQVNNPKHMPPVEPPRIIDLHSQKRTAPTGLYFNGCRPHQPHLPQYQGGFHQHTPAFIGGVWGYYGRRRLCFGEGGEPDLLAWGTPKSDPLSRE